MLVPQHEHHTLHPPYTEGVQGSLLKQSNNVEYVETFLQPHVTPPGPPYHQPSHQHTQPWGYRQETFTEAATTGNVLDVNLPAHYLYAKPTLGILIQCHVDL